MTNESLARLKELYGQNFKFCHFLKEWEKNKNSYSCCLVVSLINIKKMNKKLLKTVTYETRRNQGNRDEMV